MDVCVLSRDLIFFSAVDGVAGAMGHHARQIGSVEEVGTADVLFADFVSAPFRVAALDAAFDPLRTAIFTAHERVDVFRAARANGVAHVYRRGALAVELPRLLAEYATDGQPDSPAV